MDKSFLVAMVAVVIAIGGYLFPQVSAVLGGTTNYDILSAASLQIGSGCDNANGTCTGTRVSQLLKGSCALIGTDASQTGTSTVAYDCAVTGVVAGDTVIAQLSTSTPFSTSRSWDIVAAKASSTSGFITVLLANNGQTAIPSVTGVGSSTNYMIMR